MRISSTLALPLNRDCSNTWHQWHRQLAYAASVAMLLQHEHASSLFVILTVPAVLGCAVTFVSSYLVPSNIYFSLMQQLPKTNMDVYGIVCWSICRWRYADESILLFEIKDPWINLGQKFA
ncbi:hypothetical protein CDAR_305591 [Caerostris darwini]|uniref:Uncharacterized protein n=1 Tax=Caerostris darwini TaxID=1538125 RepID=A0AAV4PBJ9_9ARAC|nr:hypothetical protein CDAR_305591 [Caerostris darwini]